MFRRVFVLIFGLYLIYSLSCGKKGEDIVGTVEEIKSSTPQILADGLSTAVIAATVYNTEGEAAPGLKVQFTTSHGSITEYVVSDDNGLALATLTSEASEVDVMATVTATVVDTTEKLKKGNPGAFHINLEIPGQNSPGRLAKAVTDGENSAQINVLFVGVNLTATLDAQTLPADGRSKTNLNVTLKETSSRKAISGAEINLRASYGDIPASMVTDSKGTASISITAPTRATTDTIYVEYGNLIQKIVLINYTALKLQLSPSTAQLAADGQSTLTMTATLLSDKNNPIGGAEISFSTTDGIITGSSITNNFGVATATLISASQPNPNVNVIAAFYDIADTAQVAFTENVGGGLTLAGDSEIYRDGISTVQITAVVLDGTNKPMANAVVNFSANYGQITQTAITDENGQAVAEYTPDTGEEDVTDIVTASIGSISVTHEIKLLGVKMELSATPDSIPADGTSKSLITAHIKLASTNIAVSQAPVTFSTDLGVIPNLTVTGPEGLAQISLTSATQPGVANVTAEYGGLRKTVQVTFFDNFPNSIVLSAEPNFIWVKETGKIEQTIITATVLGVMGEPVNNDVKVRFTLQNGPGGGEFIEPTADGSTTESRVIRTVDGKAQVKLRAGTRSGTVEIKAELVDYPNISARTTNITIRSGPPYIWIDPNDKNNVVPHMTIAFDHLNLAGWSVVKEFNVTVYVGDKYNNPVEEGTTVYLTSTGGIVSTDISTDALGQGSAVLTSANPHPYVEPKDETALAPHRIPNPNDYNLMIPITVPDFEGGEVLNSAGNTGENDGVVYLLATTHGRDQFGNDAIVYTTGAVVFSGPIMVFTVTTDKTELHIGQAARIDIRVYDINGNPPAEGSTLTAATSSGKLSNTNLMGDGGHYGYGSTHYVTYLMNDLDPENSDPKTAEVTVKLNSPNGIASGTVYVYLHNN